MHALLYTLSTWFQPEATSGAAQSAPSGGGAGGGAPSMFGGGLGQFLPIILMMVAFYFLLIRPQSKKQKEMDALLKSLKKGQKVRTSGGIRGEIVDFKNEQGDEVVLQIADRVKINILRSHVAGVVDASAATSSATVAETEKKSG